MTVEGCFDALAASFLARGGEDILADFAPFEREFRLILAHRPRSLEDTTVVLRCVQHAIAYASWKWDPRTAAIHDVCSEAIEVWCAEPVLALDLLCALLELSYFLAWCFNLSNLDQARLILPSMRRVAERVGTPRPGRVGTQRGPLTVAYLTRAADPSSAVSACMKNVLHALHSNLGRYRSLIYVWEHLDPGTQEWLRPLDVPIIVLRGTTFTDTVEIVTRQAASDHVHVMFSDMNNAVPTVLFSRRVAPVQAFLQIGLPAWGALNLDCVFSGFGFDAVKAGWGEAAVYEFTPPWDTADLKGPDEPQRVALEATGLPAGLRVIGCYTRLVKITTDFLVAAERILVARPEICLLLGGTGDAGHIERFMRDSPAGDRMVLRRGFVSGRTWASLLHVFLDTWPFQGGGSIREVTVRGVPVVSIHSSEMPAMDIEKDPELIATDWDQFVDLTIRLCAEQSFYRLAHERALAIADRLADRSRFETTFLNALERTIRHAEEVS